MADGVQQVGLAAAGAAMEEQRVEGDALGGRQRLGGGRGDFVGLADDESLEAIARIEIRRRRDRVSRPAARRNSSRISSGVGRGRVGGGDDPHVADERQRRCQASASRSPKCERTQSAMNWLGMTRSSAPLSRIEIAKRGRLQPAVERAGAKVAAKAGRESNPRQPRAVRQLPRSAAAPGTEFVPIRPALARASSNSAIARDKASAVAHDASRDAARLFSL